MKHYTIQKKPDPFSWEKIPALSIDQILDPAYTGSFEAKGQICYDENALFVRLSCKETEIRAELRGVLDEVCNDSCMEFFFSPMAGDRRYFNIECNLNGAIYLGFGSDVHSLVRLIPEEMPICPRPQRTKDGWEVCYEVPYEFIRRFFPDFRSFSGKEMRANCFKCADLTTPPHYTTWNPTPLLEAASFHNPDGFGLMTFE